MSLLSFLPAADRLPVLATVKDAARRYAAALRAVLDRACAPARLAATGGTEHTGHTPRNQADSRGNRVSTKPGTPHSPPSRDCCTEMSAFDCGRLTLFW